MKKILLSLALLGMVVGITAPLMVSAQNAPNSCMMRKDVSQYLSNEADCPGAGNQADYNVEYGSVNGAMCCLFNTLITVIDWLFLIIMVLVVVLIMMGAFTLITSGGSEEGVSKGRNYIIYALVGVAVALLARGLPYLIRSIMGV